MSADVEIYGSVSEEHRAAALQAAFVHMTRKPILDLTINETTWAQLTVEEAVAQIERLFQTDARVSAGLLVPCFNDLQEAFVDLESLGEAFSKKWKTFEPFRLHISNGYKRLGTHGWDNVRVPLPVSKVEALAVAGYRWAKTIDALFPVANAGSRDGFANLWMGFEDGSTSPFDSYAVAHANEESFALDFARNWLFIHGGARRGDLLAASRAQLRHQLETAHEVSDVQRRLYHKNVWGNSIDCYNGSLSRIDTLRLLDTPAHVVVQAIEAAAVPASEIRELMERAQLVLDKVAHGVPSMTPSLRSSAFPYASRFHRFPAGALLLHGYQFRPVWPVYRDAAALLLSSG